MRPAMGGAIQQAPAARIKGVWFGHEEAVIYAPR